MPQRGPGLSADLQKDIQKANQKRLHRWFDELERDGCAVLRTNYLRTALSALFAWVFVLFITTAFVVLPPSTWNPLSDPSQGLTGWMQFVLGLFFVAGFFLFGFGAVLWTFIYPVVRPRLLVSWWGLRSVGWKPGGELTLFSAAWEDIVQVGGFYTTTRWPMPPLLHVTVTAMTEGVQKFVLVRARKQGATVVHGVNSMLRGRRRDVLAFLVAVHAAVLETGSAARPTGRSTGWANGGSLGGGHDEADNGGRVHRRVPVRRSQKSSPTSGPARGR